MGIIYKITNLLNGKVYIGQTRTPLRQRMYKHYSRAKSNEATGIDKAMGKYGKENFQVEILEFCDDDVLDEKERYYIKEFDSYDKGYNLTLGGQDNHNCIKFDLEEVKKLLNENGTIKGAAMQLKCCEKTLSNYMKQNNLEPPYRPEYSGNLKIGVEKMKTKVKIVELDKIFNSITDCGLWLIENKYSKAGTPNQARKSISRVLNGQRQSYCGLHFSYVEER